MTDTPEQARIRAALAAGPTPGPWRYDYEPGYCGEIVARNGEYVATFTDEPSAIDAEYFTACNPAAMTAILAHIDEQDAEIERLRADAGRYQWLRLQNWFDSPLYVCRAPARPSLGSDCPSLERLDDFIDAAMKEQP